ncbi:TIGR01777 family oxidoreductase [Sporosarcina sp. ITBMC105]
MKVVIAGGTGFIGQKITSLLKEKGHDIVILTRSKRPNEKNIEYVQWLTDGSKPEEEILSADAFINLAGVSINDGRWTPDHQQQIYDSRMVATDELIRIISALQSKPTIFLNASAIGIYPASETTIYSEASRDVADDFLGKTVHDWEQKAATLQAQGIRTAIIRFGVVLGKDEGALPLMSMPYKLFVGGKVGSGRQWVSWVHVQDVANAAVFLLEHASAQGVFNITAPFPLRMNDFGKTIGNVLHRPHWLPAPAFLMKSALGQKSALVLEGQYVSSEKIVTAGFDFDFPVLADALNDLLK